MYPTPSPPTIVHGSLTPPPIFCIIHPFQFGCMGFVEDVTGDLSKFARALSYYSMFFCPFDINSNYSEPDKQFMIWCRENVDLEQRVTPLVCMGIEQPEGILVVKKDG